MAIILSISEEGGERWAAGPHGLFRLQDQQLVPVPQPMSRLACTLALPTRLLVGGGPHGVAYSADGGANWQAAWVSGIDAAVLALAPDPDIAHSGVILAATEGEGILRTTDRGGYWSPCTFGLRSYTVLALAWAAPAPVTDWPRREIVFAGTEEGLYRSPNGGRAWKRMECADAVYQFIAVSPDFHNDGVVLAGTESDGLWRSADGGRRFDRVESAPDGVNALCITEQGWLLSDMNSLWHSADGVVWQAVPDSPPALVLRPSRDGVLLGSEEDVILWDSASQSAALQFLSPELA